MSKGIYLERRFIMSEAFRSLKTTSSYVALMVFMTKRQMEKARVGRRKGWIIKNNDEIVFTYDEALKNYGISDAKFTKAIDELVDKGFIDIAGTGMGVHQVATFYTISERRKEYGTPNYVVKKRPKGTINGGFKKGNQLGRNCKKKDG